MDRLQVEERSRRCVLGRGGQRAQGADSGTAVAIRDDRMLVPGEATTMKVLPCNFLKPGPILEVDLSFTYPTNCGGRRRASMPSPTASATSMPSTAADMMPPA